MCRRFFIHETGMMNLRLHSSGFFCIIKQIYYGMNMKSLYPAGAILALLLLTSPTHSAQLLKIHPALQGPGRFVLEGDSADVWVFFTDRGFRSQEALNAAVSVAEQKMLSRTKTRRQKVRRDRLADERDLPVPVQYVRKVLATGAKLRTASRYVNAVSVRIPRKNLQAVAELPFVQEIRPVAKARRMDPPLDWGGAQAPYDRPDSEDLLNYGPSFNQLNQINVVAAHDSGYSGAGVLVCLLDTGFFKDHEALVNQPIVAEWDFINNDPQTQNEPGDDPDQHNHGTFTWSTLGGAHEYDLYGPAYGASFILGKTENIVYEQPIEEDWYVAGLEWADSLGAEVISTSLGYFDWYTFADLDGNTTVTAVGVDIAVANGIVCVTAAGNERNSSWGHIITPADADSVIAVGAVDSDGELASFSSPGPTYDGRIKPEVCARGVSTWCAVPWGNPPGQNYSGVSGTSLSTPLIGGACALILEAHPDWTPMQVKTALMQTASNAASPDNDYGWGIIDVMAAIQYNFPPVIVQKYPQADTVRVMQDSTASFWISVDDSEGDSLTYHWWVDTVEVTVGADSQFIHQWNQPDTSTVKVVVEDQRHATDSTTWIVAVESFTGVQPEPATTPAAYALSPAFPNPFNAETTLSFDLPEPSRIEINIYDLHGRRVKTETMEEMRAGSHRVNLGLDDCSAGVYFLEFEAARYRAFAKLVYLK
jgi:hypothetical protein